MSNNEKASRDHQFHLCDTDSENTSLLLINNWNISLLLPHNIYMVTFVQALAYLACSCHVAVHHDHENSSFACIFKHLWFKNKWWKHKKTALHVQAVYFWAWFLQLGRIEVGSYANLKQTVPEFVWKRTETTSSRSWCGCLVWLLYSHLPKRSAPRGETNLSTIQSNKTRLNHHE